MSLGTVATFILIPPVNLVPLAIGGMVVAVWRHRLGLAITAFAVTGLFVFSLPAVSSGLMRGLEADLPAAAGAKPQAIVILSAEIREGQPGSVVAGIDAGPMTLERLRAGARLAKQTQLPILVSGGIGHAGWPPLAVIMAKTLQLDFGLQPKWVESLSVDTWQNALDSAAILKHDGVDSVYVVTNAWHMRRALIAFRHAGLLAVPAPDRLQAALPLEMSDFVPAPVALLASYYAVHEWIGCAVYLLRDHWAALAG